MKALPPKLEALIADARDPREDEAWFQDLPDERRLEWTQEWKDNMRRKVELGLAERSLLWRDGVQMGLLLLVADFCTSVGDAASACASLVLGLVVGCLCSFFNLERLSTPLLILPLWLLTQHLTLGGIAVMHLFVGFPLGCALAYSAVRRGERMFD